MCPVFTFDVGFGINIQAARCPDGRHVLAGGLKPESNSINVIAPHPTDDNQGWRSQAVNNAGTKNWNF